MPTIKVSSSGKRSILSNDVSIDGNIYTHDISKGLGDTIAKITKAVGIKPCGGCKKRQEKLNKAMPYKSRLKALEEKGK